VPLTSDAAGVRTTTTPPASEGPALGRGTYRPRSARALNDRRTTPRRTTRPAARETESVEGAAGRVPPPDGG